MTDPKEANKNGMLETIQQIPENITFQIIDWDFFHNEDNDGNKKFAIRLFGRDKQQQTVYVEVNDFKPYFYVELPDNWKIATVDMFVEEVKKKVPKDHVEALAKFNIEEKYKFWGFTNYKKFKFAKLTFDNFDAMKAYARAFTKAYKIPLISRKWIKVKLYESNILPVLRFMHIRQLEAVGWVSIEKSNLEEFDMPPTCCKQNYKTKFQNVVKINDMSINKFVIASFDIECKSEDGSFPQPQRDNDRIFQIGITLSKYGETECYERHLLSLKKTADIEGTIVQSFNTEEDLLLGFTKLLRQIDPDIITGYNIFGFDFMYMMERAKKLGISHRFERLSRVNGEQSPWVDQTLTSAALGTNLMKYYKMTGRVVVDLMKVAQRDFKLSSYKLDYVSSYFIREGILGIIPMSNSNKVKILTKSTYGVNVGQYIVISYEEGAVESKYNEGEKFQITELGKDYLIVELNNSKIDTTEFMGKGFKVSWCQAKDDMPIKELFKLADGTPENRAEVGHYCVMDCELVSKLVAKLQIITNSVSMANVCNVPLSYLFLRGQGVKIFSLVAKKCREKDHLIPVIQKKEKKKDWVDYNKKKDANAKPDPAEEMQKRMEAMLEKLVYQLNNKNKEEEEVDDEEELSYEGAIVFPPKPGVYFEPIPVLDYSSLYPSSMIFRNLSHECFVNDPQYDNLPGYRYHTITYKVMTKEDMDMTVKEKKEKEKSGHKTDEWVTCRFAEKIDGTKGIIPEILQDLLSARKKYKKLMEAEKDPFMKSILDGLQAAYKVTANSLYGQTGASTSPICMKEIAASTTATGREMLQFSKYFIENTFAQIIDLALGDKDKYLSEMTKIFKYFPTKISYPDINRATGQITTVNLHVCTDEKFPIPDDKFIVKSIEYEEDAEFSQNLKDLFLQIKKKIKETKFPEKDDPVGEFGKKIWEMSFERKSDFCNAMTGYIINSKGSCDGIYSVYADIFKLLEINNADELKTKLLKPMQQANKEVKSEIIEELSSMIELRNYFDKFRVSDKELFDKIYSNVLEKGKPLDDIEFSGVFKSNLFGLSVNDRNLFLIMITDYVINKTGSTKKIFESFNKFWLDLNIIGDNELKTQLLKPIQNLSDVSKEKFVNNLGTIVRDSGYSGRPELFEKFYEFVNSTLNGYTTKPEVIYGDSVTADEVLLLKDAESGKVFTTRIDELCDKWETYNGFKSNDAVEYFENVLNILLKPCAKLSNKRGEEIFDPKYLTEWIGGKYSGCVSSFINKGVLTHAAIWRVNKSSDKRKGFSTNKYGNDEAKQMAKDYLKKINEDNNMVRNKYRYVKDKNTNVVHLEVQVGDQIMLCDPDDLDIVENNCWCLGEGYVLTDHNKFHRMVMHKLLGNLPKKIQDMFTAYTVDHINGNTLDNRKLKLRLMKQKYQNRNVKTNDAHKYECAGVSKTGNVYKATMSNINGVRSDLFFDNPEDAIDCVKRNARILEKDYIDLLEQQISDIKKILEKDHKNRYNKEQSQTNYLVWSGKEWTKINRVIRHKTNKKIYRVITKTSIVDVTEDHSLIDEYGNYIRPVNCSDNIKLLQSYPPNVELDEDNVKYNKSKYSSSDKQKCIDYYLQSKSNGYNVTIEFDEKTSKFNLKRTKDKIEDPNKIISISLLKDTKETEYEYVYDLETESGRFQAGVGELIIKNTDSVFFRMGIADKETGEKLRNKKTLEMCIKIGIWASLLISTLLPKPQQQAYEKVLFPFIIQGKKRYVANLFEKDPEKFKQKSMGKKNMPLS